MGKKTEWTEEQMATIIRMSEEGHTLTAIAKAVGVSRPCIGSGHRDLWLSYRKPNPTARRDSTFVTSAMRYPLPPGHPHSWGKIIEGTCLEGSPYPGQKPRFDLLKKERVYENISD